MEPVNPLITFLVCSAAFIAGMLLVTCAQQI